MQGPSPGVVVEHMSTDRQTQSGSRIRTCSAMGTNVEQQRNERIASSRGRAQTNEHRPSARQSISMNSKRRSIMPFSTPATFRGNRQGVIDSDCPHAIPRPFLCCRDVGSLRLAHVASPVRSHSEFMLQLHVSSSWQCCLQQDSRIPLPFCAR